MQHGYKSQYIDPDLQISPLSPIPIHPERALDGKDLSLSRSANLQVTSVQNREAGMWADGLSHQC